MTRTIAFIAVVSIFFALLTFLAVYYSVRLRRKSNTAWEILLHRLSRIDRNHLERIASDVLDIGDDPGRIDLEPEMIWDWIGGLEGLQTLDANCDVLVDLAFYVQDRYPEAVVIAEELRMNARQVKWHVERLQGAQRTGNLASSFPDYAPRAIATYYLMTRRVLVLYEMLQLPEFAELELAI